MNNIHLSKIQIEICDLVLKNNNKQFAQVVDSNKYNEFDRLLAVKRLVDSNLLIASETILLTDLGNKYSKKGMKKYIKNVSIEHFLNSSIIKAIPVWAAVLISIISLCFSVFNYLNNN